MSNHLIEIKNLSVGYQQQSLFVPISTTFQAGKKYLLLGENGTGKSTLLHILAGQYRSASVIEGELSYYYGQKSLHKCPASPHFLRIVSDRQLHQISLGLSNLFVENVIASGLTANFFYQGDVPIELKQQIKDIANNLNITTFLDKQIKTLSHGQRMLVLLARALLIKPQILVLDEVESYLDTQGRAFLMDYFSTSDDTIITASHHQGNLFKEFEIIPLQSKQISQQAHLYERENNTEHLQNLARRPLINIKNGFFYRGLTPVLENINLQLDSATCYWILGQNGAGKSTLLDAIFGKIYPVQKYNPTVMYHFAKINDTPASIQHQIGYASSILAEEIEDGRGYDSLIAWQFIQATIEACHPLRLSTSSPSEATLKLATQCGVMHLLQSPLAALSSGQRRRLEITRAIAIPRQILLLDEPFNNLDKTSKAELAQLISDIVKQLGLCVVLTSHEQITGLDCPVENILVKDRMLNF